MDQIQAFPCELCSKTFVSQTDADSHMSAMNHYRGRCDLCHQRFFSESALQNHMASGIHWKYSICCPFCGIHFDKTSILMAHLEEGRCECAPGLDHHSILWLVRNCDTTGVMTDIQLRWLRSDYLASAHPGIAEVHKCFTCHRIFPTQQELEVHLQFPMANPEVHSPRFYQCPDKTGSCHRGFVSLAALFQHLESQSCRAMTFHSVQQMQQRLTNAFWGCGIGQPRKWEVVHMPNTSIMHH